jgi:hypothetical protein
MISREEFQKIRRGDVILFSGKPRMVYMGPADMTRPDHWLTLAITRPTWRTAPGRNGVTTTYCWNDLKHKIECLARQPGKRSKACLVRMEAQQLKDLGLNWRKGIADEVIRWKKCNAWRGRFKEQFGKDLGFVKCLL